MLKARVQAAMDERVQSDAVDSSQDDQSNQERVLAFRTVLNGARCPHCSHTAGLALLPREYRRLSTPVRCFSCQRDTLMFEWVRAFEWVGAPATVRSAPPRRV